MEQVEFSTLSAAGQAGPSLGPLGLAVTLDVTAGGFRFEWRRAGAADLVARGRLGLSAASLAGLHDLNLVVETGGRTETDYCNQWPASIRAFLTRLRKRFPVSDHGVQVRISSNADLGPVKAGVAYPMQLPPRADVWKWLAKELQLLTTSAEVIGSVDPDQSAERTCLAATRALACHWLGLKPVQPAAPAAPSLVPGALRLRATLEFTQGFIQLEWSDPSGRPVATGWVRCTGRDELSWELAADNSRGTTHSNHTREDIHAALNLWLARLPVPKPNFSALSVRPQRNGRRPALVEEPPFGGRESPWAWLEGSIRAMADQLGPGFLPGPQSDPVLEPFFVASLEREKRRLAHKEQRRAEEEARRRQILARRNEERRRREEQAAIQRKIAEVDKSIQLIKAASAKPNFKSQISNLKFPPEPVPVRLELPPLEFQETTFPLPDLRNYALRERAALWWVSNQSDDLLCLPYCRLERLDYQIRTALRVLGPLRGRALLSDEVGLGKTIEAGLVLKELFTRGMVKRFLVLTVPSLVDQWEEELSDKFGLTTATTNHAAARDGDRFWRENPAIVASLHTLKQPAQLEIARQVHWDILIVDEAHYLRNRESQSWQAVSALPRQFLLLLTATPVQNSLEELYNLVTLLQPGQLPTPKEFRARFIDPKRPRQPREPEELRRLLGQVMIRNTRANAGVNLPPRRAETVLFEPDPAERAFWTQWETEFRAQLAQLSASQASLWGRLLLQAAGSSPAAWRDAVAKFPHRPSARAWADQAPLAASWDRKCQLLLPLTRGEGGAVIFTQFLQTQSALADFLRGAGIATFVINGATPPPERQPITEEFHRHAGALLLTHSGTEGRNLQFSHRLANFDLPWNPMEIEQRIGRLHRLGQQHPVRIYNFVQAGTLQEHLLEILQEKLNLFELVVGETGLVLGERFSSDEFAEEVLRRWRASDGRVAEAFAGLGEELAAARQAYGEVKQLDETLFEKDYESL